ncbi:MAG: hypothetical protein WDO14_06615 [Bacteroidota bacterium]
MPRIFPLPEESTPAETRIAYSQHKAIYNARITNMKATLGHSYTAFNSYMQWYPLYQEVKAIIGNRLAPIYAGSISEAAECPLCSTYFRKAIVEAGEDPENLTVSDKDQHLLNFGAAIARNKGIVPDEIFEPIREQFSDREIVILTAFAGIMIATNIFNNVIETQIDEYLHPYLAKSSLKD